MRSQPIEYLSIGVFIGLILALQLRSSTVSSSGTLSQDVQIENQMLATLNEEHRALTSSSNDERAKRLELESAYEKNTSKKQQQLLKDLKQQSSFNTLSGEGVRITIEDGYNIGGSYFQDSELRDLVNALYLQGAMAVSINGYRITALSYIHAAFDTIFINNHQTASPFVVEALGNQDSLEAALNQIRRAKVKIRLEKLPLVQISPVESVPNIIYMSALR